MLLRTKLFRPAPPQDFVVRPRLVEALNEGLGRPLTLICAPAGYGKTSLASAFLATCPLPSAWVSLDEGDNDLRLFLEYVLAAIDSACPRAVHGTQLLLASAVLPRVAVIANSLVNELAELQQPLILTLDDVHDIRDPDVVHLLDALVGQPLPGLHVMLLTRREPPLPWAKLRMRGQVSDIRSRDLRFSAQEAAAFLQHAIDMPLSEEAIGALVEDTEGWPAGLRLATLTLRHGGDDIDRRIASLHAENRHITAYLLDEVLSRVPSDIAQFLIRTSILDRLCGPLCDAVTGVEGAPSRGPAHLAWLASANMFITSLDQEGLWYRYHHLFRVLLQRELARQLDAKEIDDLHRRASAWYASQGDIDEALRHAVAGHDSVTAGQLVAEHRHHLLNTERRPRLERWLRLLASSDIAQHPDLLLAEAWIALLGRAESQTVLALVDQAQTLVDQTGGQEARARPLQGEIDTLRCIEKGFAANDPPGVVMLATRALAAMPLAWTMARTEAWLHLALAHLMLGELDRSRTVLAEANREAAAARGAPRARRAAAGCFIHWMAADLTSMLQTAHQTVTAGQATDQQRESLGWGHYFLACGHYLRNDLAAAEFHANTVLDQRYACHRIAATQSAIVLAAIDRARCDDDGARQGLDRASAFLLEIDSPALLPVVQAYGAELAAGQGDLDAAGAWAATVGPRVPLSAMAFFYAPQLTLPKVLLAINTPESRQQAAAALARLHTFVTQTHNTRFTIDVLALQALLHQAQGNEPAALQALQQAVALAKPGGLVRVFVDLGRDMATLLQRLAHRESGSEYIAQVLRAFPAFPPPFSSPTRPAPQAALIEPLTWREQEVLELLAQRLSGKEIAQRLVISEATAKRHCANIYQKLAVSGRREAVAAAQALGILPGRPG
jgi:LuxR family maltose regulon positive regulatory protein